MKHNTKFLIYEQYANKKSHTKSYTNLFCCLCDVNQVNPWVKWGPPKYYLLKDFAKLSLHIVLEHQADTNMSFSKHDQQSNNWLYALVFNSTTFKLCDNVIPTYNEILSSQQGRITLTNLVGNVLDMSRTCPPDRDRS